MKFFFDAVDRSLRTVISLLILSMTAVIFYQVIMRYCFHSSTIWAEEFARYAFIWVVMLGSACGIRNGKHIRVEFLIDRLAPNTRFYVENFAYVLMILMLALLAFYGAVIAGQTIGQLSPGLHVSRGFMYLSIPTGSVLMIIFTVEILLSRFKKFGKKEETI